MKRLLPCLTVVIATLGQTACEPTLVIEATPGLASPPLSPGLICQEQHDIAGTPLTLTGSGLAAMPFGLPADPRLALPSLTFTGRRAVDGSTIDVPAEVAFDGLRGGENADLLRWTSTTQMTVLVPDQLALGGAPGDVVGPVPAGLYDLAVVNPDGQGVTAVGALAVVERPTLTRVAPPLVCVAQAPRTVVVSGSGALVIDTVLPTVTVGGVAASVVPSGCVAIDQAAQDAQICDTVSVTLAADALDVGEHAIVLTNPAPADCQSTDAISVLVVPPPTITGITPAALCQNAGTTTLTVDGADLLIVDDLPFAVTLNGAAATPVPVAASCTTLPVPGADSPVVQTCTQFTVDVDTAALPLGSVEIVVTNPEPAGCTASTRALLRIDPVPVLASVEPEGTCQDSGDVTLTVAGSGFAVLDGATFSVDVGGTVVAPSGLTGCVDLGAEGVVQQACTGFSVTVDADVFPVGSVPVTVTNPGPSACVGTAADLFAVSPAPIVEAVDPTGLCTATAGATVDVTISGRGFVVAGTDAFVVRVDGVVTPAVATGCVDVALPGGTVQSCSAFTIAVDVAGRPEGRVGITIDNPALPGCTGTTSTGFDILPPPTLTGIIVADDLCSDVLTTFVLTGTGLSAGTTVDVGGRVADLVVPNAAGTEATVTFSDGLPAGDVLVGVSNGDCDAGATFPLAVDPSPIVFFVNPPVLFDGISIDATIFASALAADPVAVSLVDAAGTSTALVFADGGRPGRILATIPAGLPVGDYAVRVTNELLCESAIDGTLTITDRLTLPIETIDPAFVSSTVPSGITLRTTSPLPAGTEGFTPVPQVYLNPADGSGQAIALRAVEVIDAGTVTAVVDGAAPGVYDVVVVNPTGAVGLLVGGLTVTVNEPPRVTSVAPASLDAGSTTAITVTGDNFDTLGARVSLDCRDFDTGTAVAPGTVSVTTTTTTSIDAVVDAAGVSAGSVCVVVVENADGAAFRFSALSFKEPSQNLGPWRTADASPLVEARRGLALVAGRPTDTSRFLYGIGGDAGTTGSAKTSVEAVSVDDVGTLGQWTLQRHDLGNAFVAGVISSQPRTLAGAVRAGRFVYVIGGHDGTAATTSVLRAAILDPLDAPEILDLDADLGDGVRGLPGGTFIYRVAALLPLSDVDNPGGETLGGELFNVVVPALDAGLVITLTWERVPGATGYRLYRSPAANAGADALELLAETTGDTATTFVDDDQTPTTAAVRPLRAGSLGRFHAVSSLNAPREAHATLSVPDPGNANQVFVYAVGGRSGATTALGSGEVATITLDTGVLSSWRSLTASLSVPRAELTGMAITATDAPAAGNKTLLFFTTGRRGNGQLAGVVESAELGANGDLTAFAVKAAPNPSRAGSAGLSANGFLYLFGGANGNASSNDVSSELLDDTPTLDNWDALGGGSMSVARRFAGAAQESAFFFIAGGDDGTAPITTVEQNIQ